MSASFDLTPIIHWWGAHKLFHRIFCLWTIHAQVIVNTCFILSAYRHSKQGLWWCAAYICLLMKAFGKYADMTRTGLAAWTDGTWLLYVKPQIWRNFCPLFVKHFVFNQLLFVQTLCIYVGFPSKRPALCNKFIKLSCLLNPCGKIAVSIGILEVLREFSKRRPFWMTSFGQQK